MEGISGDLIETLRELEPFLRRLDDSRRQVRIKSEEVEQLQALVDLRQSLDALNENLGTKLSRRRGFFSWISR